MIRTLQSWSLCCQKSMENQKPERPLSGGGVVVVVGEKAATYHEGKKLPHTSLALRQVSPKHTYSFLCCWETFALEIAQSNDFKLVAVLCVARNR